MKTASQATAMPEKRRCACGCGQTPKLRKSRFCQGHDRKVEAQFLQVLRERSDGDPLPTLHLRQIIVSNRRATAAD